MQNILLDGCYLRFEEYLQENTSFYILKSAEKQAKVLKKSLLCVNNKTLIEFVFIMHINWK